MKKVRVILWVKILGYLAIVGHGPSVESAAKCRQKRNVCAVKKWSQFDVSTYMVTKIGSGKYCFRKILCRRCLPSLKLLFNLLIKSQIV